MRVCVCPVNGGLLTRHTVTGKAEHIIDQQNGTVDTTLSAKNPRPAPDYMPLLARIDMAPAGISTCDCWSRRPIYLASLLFMQELMDAEDDNLTISTDWVSG